jgi:peroxiredoxin
VPGYLAKQDELKAKGVAAVIVFCVNDGAVMKAWADDMGVKDSMISFFGDPQSEVTQALGLVLKDKGPMAVLGNHRCKRFSMLIEDGTVKSVNVAASKDDPAGDEKPDVSLVEKILEDCDKLAASKGPKPPKVKIGDAIPEVELDKGFPPEKVALKDFCQGKKVVLVGLPGAFTPT